MTTHPEYDRSTDASTVADAFASHIKGRVFLITGISANGIGGATAKALASYSPRLLILTGRTEQRVQPVISDIRSSYPSTSCRYLQLDLASQASVRKAAAEVNSYGENVDVLINNAGVAQIAERTLNDAGIELHFATNHIGHFLFTNLILPKLSAAASTQMVSGATRIVNLASSAHRYGPVRFSDINFTKGKEDLSQDERPNYELAKDWGPIDKPYIPMAAYAQSKTANILFTVSLSQKLMKSGIPVFAVNPGVVMSTDVLRYADPDVRESAEKRLTKLGQTVEQGSSTTLVAALDPQLEPGGERVYLSDCQLKETAPWAVDETAASNLWALSERMVGEKFVI